VPQKLVIEPVFVIHTYIQCLLGVLKSVVTYMEGGSVHFVSDFRDGQLRQQHLVRICPTWTQAHSCDRSN
jgi:hypothetical protein